MLISAIVCVSPGRGSLIVQACRSGGCYSSHCRSGDSPACGFSVKRRPLVGASLLAMVVQAPRGIRYPELSLTSIASPLAPTGDRARPLLRLAGPADQIV